MKVTGKAVQVKAGVDALMQLKGRFATWRARRKLGMRIPPQLWAAAVDMVAVHGACRVAPAPQRRYDTAALAAGIPKSPEAGADADADADADGPDAGEADATPEDSVVLAERAELEATPAPPPTWHATGNGARAARTTVETAAVAQPRSANQQIELARAYLDLGDDDAARALLREVLDGRDPAARNEAARMLREL